MTLERIDYIIICVLVSIIVIVRLVLWFAFPEYNEDCLNEFANHYCIENNFTFTNNNNYNNCDTYIGDKFCCNMNVNLRTDKEGRIISFYYLPEEKESCLIKKAWSLR